MGHHSAATTISKSTTSTKTTAASNKATTTSLNMNSYLYLINEFYVRSQKAPQIDKNKNGMMFWLPNVKD